MATDAIRAGGASDGSSVSRSVDTIAQAPKGLIAPDARGAREDLQIRAEEDAARQNRWWTWFRLIMRMASIVFLAGFFAFGSILWGWTLWDLMSGDKREIYFSQLQNFLLGALSGGAGIRVLMYLLGNGKK